MPQVECPDLALWDTIFNNDSTPEVVEQFAYHLEHCSRCSQRIDELAPVVGMVSALRAVRCDHPMDEEAIESAMRRIELLSDRYVESFSTHPSAAPTLRGLPVASERSAELDREIKSVLQPPTSDGLGTLGDFHIQRLLGAGGMGIVFRAEDPVLKRPVALKVMRLRIAAEPSARARFLREARLLAAVRHDHVVTIFGAGEANNTVYLSMELLDGETLASRLQRQSPLPADEVIRIGREAALGLAAVHSQGVIHRDIKPGNLWVENGSGRVKVLDFGLARMPDSDTQLTGSQIVVGTPEFMSPEQADGESTEARSDLFSLGSVLYCAATGKMPFTGATTLRMMRAIATEQPTPPAKVNPKVPDALSELIMRLLAKRPADRPQSAQLVAEALRAVAAVPTTTPATPVSAPTRRKLPWMAIAAGLLLVAGIGLVAAQIINRDAQEIPVQPWALASGQSNFDKLDRNQIPVAERLEGLSKDVVAVLGSSERRMGGTQMVFSHDEKLLVTRHHDWILDLETRTLRRPTVEIHTDHIASGSPLFLRDGVDGLNEGVYQMKDGESVLVHPFPFGSTHRARFSPDRKALFAIDRDNKLHLFNVTRDKLTSRAVLDDALWATFSMFGDVLAVAHRGDVVRIYDVRKAQPHERTSIPVTGSDYEYERLWKGAQAGFGFNADGLAIVLDGKDSAITAYDVAAEARVVAKISAKELGGASWIACSPRGTRVVYGIGHWFSVLDLKGDKFIRVPSPGPRLAASNLTTLAYAPDGKSMATGSLNGFVSLWDITGAEIKEIDPLPANATSFAVGPTGMVAVTTEDRGGRLWNFGAARPMPIKSAFDGHRGDGDFAFSTDGKLLARESRLIAIDSPERFRDTNLIERGWMLGFVGSEKLVVLDGKFQFWDARAEPVRKVSEIDIGQELSGKIMIAPDGKTIVGRTPEGICVCTITPEGVVRRVVPNTKSDNPGGFSISADGRLLGVAGYFGLTVWDLSKEKLESKMTVQRSHTGVAFSPDNSLVVSGLDGSIVVRDIATGETRRSWNLPYSAQQLAFAPDGRHVLVLASNQVIYVFRISPDAAK